jgi:hypothetical protein
MRAVCVCVAICAGARVYSDEAASGGSSVPKPIPPLASRSDLGALLTAEGMRVGIEVGVQMGTFLEVLLQSWHTCDVLFGLDPWLHQTVYVDVANKEQDTQNSLMRTAARRLAPYGNSYLVRDGSPGGAAHFPDEFFDFVYLDAR